MKKPTKTKQPPPGLLAAERKGLCFYCIHPDKRVIAFDLATGQKTPEQIAKRYGGTPRQASAHQAHVGELVRNPETERDCDLADSIMLKLNRIESDMRHTGDLLREQADFKGVLDALRSEHTVVRTRAQITGMLQPTNHSVTVNNSVQTTVALTEEQKLVIARQVIARHEYEQKRALGGKK